MIQVGQVSVTTSATKLCDVPAGFQVTVVNGAAAFTLGTASTVTTANGTPIPASAVVPPIVAGEDGATLYGIVGTGTATVGFILSRRT